ncbi:MAG TPA: HAD family hydrolase [Candidatus Binatia bacterium]|nr:HAD family hydrolase [Candidatus Binatia bacterium]
MNVVLFDLDDTLLDYSGGNEDCWRQSAVEVAVPAGVDLAPLIEALAEARRWLWSDPERHRRERTDMLGAWRKIAERALSGRCAEEVRLAASMADDYAARRRAAWCLFPEALAVLGALRARDARLALVTNGDLRHQRDKIDRHGLAGFFDAILIEGEQGIGKPDPLVYRRALDALRAAAAEATMVGDNLEWDVAAPQRLGLRGIWIDREAQGLPAGSPDAPDRIIRDLRELLEPPPVPPSSPEPAVARRPSRRR